MTRDRNAAMTIARLIFLLSASLLLPGCSPAQPPPGPFTGSEACRDCHEAVYDRWKDTLMANVLADVREHPDAILGDFSTPNPLVTFDHRDIAFTYGSEQIFGAAQAGSNRRNERRVTQFR